jgi:hypothetical protein
VIRFGTLWFGVIVGLVALAIVSRELKGRQPATGKVEAALPDGESVSP